MTTITIKDFHKIRNRILIALIITSILTILLGKTITDSNNPFVEVLSWGMFLATPVIMLIGCILFLIKVRQYFQSKSYEVNWLNFKKIWGSMWLIWFLCMELSSLIFVVSTYYSLGETCFGGIFSPRVSCSIPEYLSENLFNNDFIPYYYSLIPTLLFALSPIVMLVSSIFIDIQVEKKLQTQWLTNQ